MLKINDWAGLLSPSIQWIAASFCFASVVNANAADVSLSLHGQVLPGVYGQVQVVTPSQQNHYRDSHRGYQQVIIHQPSPEIYVVPAPRYAETLVIYAPKKHRRHWKKHCHHYQACGRRVKFIEAPPRMQPQTREYYGTAEPQYRGREEHRRSHHPRH